VSYRAIKRQEPEAGELTTVGLYWARVRVRVHGYESQSDVGCGIVVEQTADAHETAIKAAVTDGTKRGLRRWGRQFGNDLYEKADPGRQAAERELADLRATVFALGTQLGLDEAETRVQASRRSGRGFLEMGCQELASVLRSMAETLVKHRPSVRVRPRAPYQCR
jgi:hypothetical protein